MHLSFVIPCYNEAPVIEETNSRLINLCEQWTRDGTISDFDILYVDDGSTDETLDRLAWLAKDDSRIMIISFTRNFGQQAAIAAGIKSAGGDAIVCLDADLQDPPEVVEKMIERYNEGCNIVYGIRAKRSSDSRLKRLTAEGYYRVMRWMGIELVFNHSEFRLISRRVAKTFDQFSEVNLFLRGLFPFMGFKVGFVTYERLPRNAGQTKYTWGKMISLSVVGITSFTAFPLRFILMLGIIILLGTLGTTAWTVFNHISEDATPRWAAIVLPIYFLGGIILIAIGIVGEYIGKIFKEVKRRPLYIIGDTINLPGNDRVESG